MGKERVLFGSRSDEDPNSGYSLIHGEDDAWLVFVDRNGEILWERNFGGSSADGAYIFPTSHNGSRICGIYTNSNDHDMINLNPNGDEKIAFISIDQARGIEVLGLLDYSRISDITMTQSTLISDFIFLAGVSGHGASADGMFVKINYKTGEILFKKTIAGSEFDGIFNIHARKNGNLIIGGKTELSDGDFDGRNSAYNTWLMELDSMGNIIDKFYPQGRGTAGNFVDFLLTDDEEIIVLSANGDVDNFPEHYGPFEHEQPTDFYIYKLGYQPTGINKFSKQAQEFTVFPNPNNTGFLHSSLIGDYVLLDTQGRRVKTFENTQYLDVGTLDKGLYLLHHSSGSWNKVFID